MAFRKKRTRKPPTDTAPELPRVSDAEWVVMKVVWQKAPVTANQVVEALAKQIHWKPKTVQTLLARLVQKGALAADKSQREYVFQPLFQENDCMHAVSQSFLRRFFGGEIAPFLACFLEREKLSPQEIDELKRILDGRQS
jgi:BlaI family penicillinase repressor